MRCFETAEIDSLLHPSSIEGVAGLARLEAHAESCATCGGRLADLRRADRALGEGLAAFVDASPCPEAEDLALAGEDFGQASPALVAHLSACGECRADLFEALEADEVATATAPRRTRSGRARRPSSRTRRGSSPQPLGWALAAAALLSASLLGIALLEPEGATTAQLPAQPFRAVESPSPIKVGPAPALEAPPIEVSPSDEEPRVEEAPSREPRVEEPRLEESAVEPAAEPAAKPAEKGDREPVASEEAREGAPAEPAPAEAPLEEAPAPEKQPSQSPAPEGATPEQGETSAPAPSPAPSQVAAALQVSEAQGLFVRVPGQRRFQAFEAGELPEGAVLRSQRGGARVQLSGGVLFLAQEGELEWRQGLQLSRGQVFLEGRQVEVQSAQGAVEVRGRALLEVRKGKLGVRLLAGAVRWVRGEERENMSAGDVLLAEGKGSPRIGRAQGEGAQAAPAWVRKLRVARRRAGRGGPGLGPGRGPRKPGGGPGRRGGGRSR